MVVYLAALAVLLFTSLWIEDELSGKTLLIVGLGRIGSRLATLARGFRDLLCPSAA